MNYDFSIKVPIYDRIVYIYTSEESLQKDAGKIDFDLPMSGITVGEDDGSVRVGIYDNSLGTLSHELMHATVRMLESIGIPTKTEFDEPAAYLQGWLMEKIVKKLSKNGYKFKEIDYGKSDKNRASIVGEQDQAVVPCGHEGG